MVYFFYAKDFFKYLLPVLFVVTTPFIVPTCWEGCTYNVEPFPLFTLFYQVRSVGVGSVLFYLLFNSFNLILPLQIIIKFYLWHLIVKFFNKKKRMTVIIVVIFLFIWFSLSYFFARAEFEKERLSQPPFPTDI